MWKLIALPICAVLFVGCGAHRMSPVDPSAVGDLKPDVEDSDGGLVSTRPSFAPKTYTAIMVVPFKVSSAEIKDEEDARFAKDMTAHLQAQLLKRLESRASSRGSSTQRSLRSIRPARKCCASRAISRG